MTTEWHEDEDSDVDSLFDEVPSRAAESPIAFDAGHRESCKPALRTAPLIRGLFFHPNTRLDRKYAEELMWTCIRAFFQDGSVNQIMLFERAPTTFTETDSGTQSSDERVSHSLHDRQNIDAHLRPRGRLPPFLCDLLQVLSDLLRPILPPKTHALLFPPPTASMLARQAILNLYWPGEGITPHVDLLDRFADGIIGVSLGSGCVMDFERTQSKEPMPNHTEPHENLPHASSTNDDPAPSHRIYLPEGSVIVLSEDARYLWTHGIAYRTEDLVEETGSSNRAVESRGLRLSITFRWLLPGADIVGGPALNRTQSVSET